MAEDAPENNDAQKAKPKIPLKTLLILLAVFLLEGGAISIFWAMKKGPAPAEATNAIEQTKENANDNFAEVVLVEDFQVDNYTAGRNRMVVTIEVAAKVEILNKEKLEKEVTEHRKEILNAVRVLVSSAQHDQIKDPKLEVMKRRIKAGVEEIVGEDLIKEILMPTWQTYVAE